MAMPSISLRAVVRVVQHGRFRRTLALAAILAAPGLTQTTHTVTSGPATLGLIDDATYGVSLSYVSHGTETFQASSPPGPLFDFEAWSRTAVIPSTDPEFQTFTVSKVNVLPNASSTVTALAGGGLQIDWTGISGPNGYTYAAQVKVRPVGTSDFAFTSRVTPTAWPIPAQPQGVGIIDCPRLHFEDPGEGAELITGMNGGLRIGNPIVHGKQVVGSTDEVLEFEHPGNQLPILALTDEEHEFVLVLSTPDAPPDRFAKKRFRFDGPLFGAGVRLSAGRFLESPFAALTTAKVASTILGVLEVTHPDSAWFDIAKWHRDRVVSHGELTAMSELTEPLEIEAVAWDVVLAQGPVDLDDQTPDYAGFVDYADVFAQYMGVDPERMRLVWFDWHANAAGQDLPSQHPARDPVGFIAAIADAQQTGYHVLPYTSSSLLDPDHTLYDADWLALREDGLPQITEAEPLDGDFTDVDRRIIDRFVSDANDALLDYLFFPLIHTGNATYGMDGIYLDFFLDSRPCFGAHGHPGGGGSTFSDGVDDYFEAIGALLDEEDKPRTLFMEAISEVTADVAVGAGHAPWTDFWNIPRETQGFVPIYQAVYHEYVPTVMNYFFDTWDGFGRPDECFEPGSFAPKNWLVYYLDSNPVAQLAAAQAYEQQVALSDSYAWAIGSRLLWSHRAAFDLTACTPAGCSCATELGNPFPDTILDIPAGTDVQKEFVSIKDYSQVLFELATRPDNRPFLYEGRLRVPPRLCYQPSGGAQVCVGTEPTPLGLHDPLVPYDHDDIPAVFSMAFTDDAGNVALTFVNWTESAKTVAYTIDPGWYDMDLIPNWNVTVSTPDGEFPVFSGQLDTSPGSAWLGQVLGSLPKRTPMVVRFEKQ